MLHVSDGEIHAYLDEALDEFPPEDAARIRDHLEACEACALRLEEERRGRKLAGVILESAAPTQVEPPPFEEIQRRSAGATVERTQRRRLTRITQLGWAASVVLALGLGWVLGREPRLLAPPTGDTFAEVDQLPSAAPPTFRVGDPDTPGRAGESPAGFADAELGSVVVPAESEVQVLGLSGTAIQEAAVRQAPLAEAASNERVGGRTAPAGNRAEEQAQRRDAAGEAAPPGGPPAAAQAAPPTEVVAGGRVSAESRDEAAVPPLAAAVDSIALDRRELRTRANARALEAVAPLAERESDLAKSVLADQPEIQSGTAGLVLPGHEVVSVQWTELAPGVPGVHVVQRLAGDTVLVELFHGGAGFGASQDDARGQDAASEQDAQTFVPAVVLDALAGDARQVATASPHGWTLIRGRLTDERLQELLDLLR